MLLFYIRHGEPTYNEHDELTPNGKCQVEALSKRLALYGIDEVYASPVLRAQISAYPTIEKLNKKINVVDVFSESGVWDEITGLKEDGTRTWMFWINKYREAFLSKDVINLGYEWYKADVFKDIKGEQMTKRVQKGLDDFFSKQGFIHDYEHHCFHQIKENDKRIAIFAHQGFSMSFLSYILDIPYPMVSIHFDMCPSGMTVIDMKKDENGNVIPRVLTVSNNGHLYKEGLPLNYNGDIKF